MKEIFSQELSQRETNIKKVHTDLEDLQKRLDSTSFAHKEERERLEQQIAQKESEQKAKLAEYDQKVQNEFDARERAEREREAARGDAAAEKARLASLLKVIHWFICGVRVRNICPRPNFKKDLEEDASGYNRLRPSKPLLTEEDTNILRQLFLSSAVAGSGKFSFQDLKQVLAKYAYVQIIP